MIDKRSSIGANTKQSTVAVTSAASSNDVDLERGIIPERSNNTEGSPTMLSYPPPVLVQRTQIERSQTLSEPPPYTESAPPSAIPSSTTIIPEDAVTVPTAANGNSRNTERPNAKPESNMSVVAAHKNAVIRTALGGPKRHVSVQRESRISCCCCCVISTIVGTIIISVISALASSAIQSSRPTYPY
ncbi:hypothetical protein CPB86DRAFT_46697 [Serendipita vermifera]|nr:hypothetical protein CPB86DRAFT_46697 [Serendipita vermifera]